MGYDSFLYANQSEMECVYVLSVHFHLIFILFPTNDFPFSFHFQSSKNRMSVIESKSKLILKYQMFHISLRK